MFEDNNFDRHNMVLLGALVVSLLLLSVQYVSTLFLDYKNAPLPGIAITVTFISLAGSEYENNYYNKKYVFPLSLFGIAITALSYAIQITVRELKIRVHSTVASISLKTYYILISVVCVSLLILLIIRLAKQLVKKGGSK